MMLLPTAANETCPQPQTSEHLAAIEIMKLKHILILQNKIDLCRESQLREQYDQILRFIQGVLLIMLPLIMVQVTLSFLISHEVVMKDHSSPSHFEFSTKLPLRVFNFNINNH